MHELGIDAKTSVDWCNFIRDICGSWVEDHSQPIGGLDPQGNSLEVQIDESKFMHRKYHRGQMRDGHWVFGGIETATGNCFMVECPNNRRDAATLLPIIQQWILPGTTIVSDLWRAYGGVAALPQNYTHLTVNHSVNFVDPVTGAHTQMIEGHWSQVKRKYRQMNGTSDALFNSYLSEYIFRKHYKINVFMNIIYWIRHYY